MRLTRTIFLVKEGKKTRWSQAMTRSRSHKFAAPLPPFIARLYERTDKLFEYILIGSLPSHFMSSMAVKSSAERIRIIFRG